MRTNDVRVHPREMVIDGVFLGVLRSLHAFQLAHFPALNSKAQSRTPLSMQTLNCCSIFTQAAAAWPEEAQQPRTVDMMPRHGFISALFGRLTLRWGSGGRRGAPTLFAAPRPDGFGTIVVLRHPMKRWLCGGCSER
jgi:hypothetical protein